jgi:Raf kinase inhibitor-like YbhB/YbcL family protein
MGVALSTDAFGEGGDIPRKYTCDGADLSPALSWQGIPPGTAELVLIMDDPDAPGGTFTHWLIYGIPLLPGGLPEAVQKVPALYKGARQGINSFGKTGYSGPCPPPGKPHRYYIRLFCLDRPTGLPVAARRPALEAAMKGHIIGQGELMGRYRIIS